MKGEMRKPTRTTLRRKLDKEVSRITRARGRCAKCHKSEYELLQTAHIFSRKNLSVRWDLLNVLCLCAGCHFWAHQNPTLFTEFLRDFLGEYNYAQLKLRATAIKKWSVEDMQELLDTLNHNESKKEVYQELFK